MDRSALKQWRFWVVVTVSTLIAVYLFFAVRAILAPPSPTAGGDRMAVFQRGPDGVPVVKSLRKDAPVKIDLEPGDRVVGAMSVRGERVVVTGEFSMGDLRRAIHYNEPWSLLVQRKGADGRWSEVKVPVPAQPAPPRPGAALLGQIVLLLLFPLVSLFAAVAISYLKPGDRNVFNASLFFLSAIALVWPVTYGDFPPGGRELALGLYVLLFSTLTAFFLRFFLLFPSPSLLYRKAPWLSRAALGFGLAFALWNAHWHALMGYSYAGFNRFARWAYWVDRPMDALYVLLFFLGLASLALNFKELHAPDERRRLGILLLGSLGFLPAFALYLNLVLGSPIHIPSWVNGVRLVAALAFPVCFAVAVVRYRLFGVRVILRKGLQFALLSRGFLFLEGIVLFLLLYYAAVPVMGTALAGADPMALAVGIAAVTMAALLGVRQINRGVMHGIERRFFREAYDARRILTDLSLRVRKMASDPEGLITTVLETVADALHPRRAAIFLRGTEIANLAFKIDLQDRYRAKRGDEAVSFYCHWHRFGTGGGERGERAEHALGDARLPADSLVAQRLETAAAGEVEVLEVRLYESRSWAHALLSDDRAAERGLVERCKMNLLVPLVAGKRLLGFLSLGEKLSEEPYSGEDKEILLAVAQQVADSLDHARLLKEGQEQAIMKREMEIAREVQEKLFPQGHMSLPSLDYAGACKPAREVGGDYYDFLTLDDHTMAIALGDISGKGVSAALLMASLQAMLRIHAKAHGPEAAKVVADINGLMCSATDKHRFATLFYGVYDANSLTLNYVNAGHNPPMLFRRTPGGTQVVRLRSTGTVLGVFPGTEYRQEKIQLQPGDLLVLFSDGVTEAMDGGQEFFGDGRLEELVTGMSQLPAVEIRDRILESVERFAHGHPQNDDITLIAAKVVA